MYCGLPNAQQSSSFCTFCQIAKTEGLLPSSHRKDGIAWVATAWGKASIALPTRDCCHGVPPFDITSSSLFFFSPPPISSHHVLTGAWRGEDAFSRCQLACPHLPALWLKRNPACRTPLTFSLQLSVAAAVLHGNLLSRQLCLQTPGRLFQA